jgi:hypothetical protein
MKAFIIPAGLTLIVSSSTMAFQPPTIEEYRARKCLLYIGCNHGRSLSRSAVEFCLWSGFAERSRRCIFDPLQIPKKTAKAVCRGDHRKYYLKEELVLYGDVEERLEKANLSVTQEIYTPIRVPTLAGLKSRSCKLKIHLIR